jgi:hypothetical protein
LGRMGFPPGQESSAIRWPLGGPARASCWTARGSLACRPTWSVRLSGSGWSLAYLPRLSNAIASAATPSREPGRRDDRIRRDARPMVLARRDVAPATKRSPVGARGVLGRLRGVSQRGWAWSRGQAVTRSRGAQAGAGGDDRRRSVMHGVNDLRVVNPLQINARDAEMGMPELALDDHHWDPLMRHLHGVGMPKLMRREPAAYPGPGAGPAQLPADRCR